MEFLIRLKSGKKVKKSDSVRKDSIDRIGSEQIKKMIERGMQMPVISI